MTSELEGMTLNQLAEYIAKRLNEGGSFTRDERLELHDYLGRKIAWAGALWDRVDGVDPYIGQLCAYGTPNRRSMTYKARKLAGYSYP